MTPPDAVDDASVDLPVPESLLVPLLDVAARVVGALDASELTPVLRPLAGFDRRGLQSGPARQQLRRALEVDAKLRATVSEQFASRAAVRTEIERWEAANALACAEEAAERDDLALLASALWAARPEGWSFGLGIVCAVAERHRAVREQDDDDRARETQLAGVEEARRRAEQARDDARAMLTELEEELKAERRSRRGRERKAEQEVELATKRREETEGLLERSRRETENAQTRLEREAARRSQVEQRLKEVQRALDTVDARSLPSDAEPVAPAREPTPPKLEERADPPDAVADADVAAAADDPPTPTRPTQSRRTGVKCPPGLTSDSPDAVDTMLRTRGVVLVIDGYNVSMAGWPDATAADQRARLVAALEGLHLRLRCDSVVVFDGADVEASPMRRRAGVRVRFSPPGEEADPVVVREVADHPLATPVIVASSDRWVRDHAEREGATVIHAATLVAVLRR